MAIEGHVENLKLKHADLESAIEYENQQPNPDETTLHDLKRQKLKIKDELTRISSA